MRELKVKFGNPIPEIEVYKKVDDDRMAFHTVRSDELLHLAVAECPRIEVEIVDDIDTSLSDYDGDCRYFRIDGFTGDSAVESVYGCLITQKGGKIKRERYSIIIE